MKSCSLLLRPCVCRHGVTCAGVVWSWQSSWVPKFADTTPNSAGLATQLLVRGVLAQVFLKMGLKVTPAEKDELLVTFAALILNDDGAPITADNITTLIKAAGATVEPYWPKLFGERLPRVSQFCEVVRRSLAL
jgi:hypothetical protein